MAEYLKQYGDTFVVKIGPFRRLILTTDCKFVEAVLNSTKILTKSEDYARMNSWLGTGLLTSDGNEFKTVHLNNNLNVFKFLGDKWKKHRRILTPAFHFQILESFISVFNSCGNVLLNKLVKKVGQESVDIYPLVTLYALDLICGN